MTPTADQVALFQSVSPAGSRTTVRSGHGTGKSRALGVLALWHLLCYERSNTVITAPKIEQVRSVVWKEIADVKEAIRTGSQPWISSYFEVKAEKVYILGFEKQWFIIAKTAPRGSPENLAGMHRKWYLIIADEASGIPDANYAILTGALTDKRNRMLMVSQPTRPSGFFYNSHHKMSADEGGVWHSIRMNSESSPLVSPDFILEKRAEYTDDEYSVKVLGEFPETQDGYLLGRKQAEACFGRQAIPPGQAYGIILSCDVGAGEYRDKSVALVAHITGDGDFGADARRVQVVAVPVLSNTKNLQDFSGMVFHAAAELENVTIMVDAGGMGIAVCQNLEGMGLTGLKRVKWGAPCFKLRNKERFFNLRAQAMCYASRAAREGRLGIADGPWRADLLDQMSRVPYHFDEKARYTIERKEEMRKVGLPSPDVWDAICFTFLEGADYMLCEGRGVGGGLSATDALLARVAELFAGVI